MSTRLSENPFSNPFASQREATGAVPAPAVERRELPQYSRQQSLNPAAAPPAVSAPHTYLAAARAPTQADPLIIVGTSDTLEGLARRYHVTSAAILQANGYRGPRALSP